MNARLDEPIKVDNTNVALENDDDDEEEEEVHEW
jgi:hypothetical protein